MVQYCNTKTKFYLTRQNDFFVQKDVNDIIPKSTFRRKVGLGLTEELSAQKKIYKIPTHPRYDICTRGMIERFV